MEKIEFTFDGLADNTVRPRSRVNFYSVEFLYENTRLLGHTFVKSKYRLL